MPMTGISSKGARDVSGPEAVTMPTRQSQSLRRQCGVCGCSTQTRTFRSQVMRHMTDHEIIHRLQRYKIGHG